MASSTALVFSLGTGKSVFINLRGGDDTIVLGDNPGDGGSRSLAILGNLRIDLGDGNNTVGLENLFVRGTTTIRAGAGNDIVDIDTTPGGIPTFLKGNFTATLGDGNNQVIGETFGVGGNVSITTGADDDIIDLTNATIAKNLLIAANDGDNQISITDSDVDGNITRISTGLGDDIITLASSDFKRLFVLAGDGTNTVDVDGVTAVSVNVTTGDRRRHREHHQQRLHTRFLGFDRRWRRYGYCQRLRLPRWPDCGRRRWQRRRHVQRPRPCLRQHRSNHPAGLRDYGVISTPRLSPRPLRGGFAAGEYRLAL
jgi:hypothetical protein